MRTAHWHLERRWPHGPDARRDEDATDPYYFNLPSRCNIGSAYFALPTYSPHCVRAHARAARAQPRATPGLSQAQEGPGY